MGEQTEIEGRVGEPSPMAVSEMLTITKAPLPLAQIEAQIKLAKELAAIRQEEDQRAHERLLAI